MPVAEVGGHLATCQQVVEPSLVLLVIGIKSRQHVAAVLSCEAHAQRFNALGSDDVNLFIGRDRGTPELADPAAGVMTNDPQRPIILDLGRLESRSAVIAKVPQDHTPHSASGPGIGVQRRSRALRYLGHSRVELGAPSHLVTGHIAPPHMTRASPFALRAEVVGRRRPSPWAVAVVMAAAAVPDPVYTPP